MYATHFPVKHNIVFERDTAMKGSAKKVPRRKCFTR